MKTLFATALLFLSLGAHAQDITVLDAGLADAGFMDAGVLVPDDLGQPGLAANVGTIYSPAAINIDNPLAFAVMFHKGVMTGDWWLAAAALLVLFVSALRLGGKKLHDWLPDNHWADQPLIFIFDTKPGGWLMNVLTTISIGLLPSLISGEKISWEIVKPVLMVSTSATALFHLYKDLKDWWAARQKKVADAPALPPPPTP